MGGHDVALAMSNGELCHANISKGRPTAPTSVSKEDRRWPHWSSWPTRHGKVLSLEYDQAHDALVTIEQATTAAGDQAFLGRYHRQAGLASKERKWGKRDRMGHQTSEATATATTTITTPWVGSSVPLATNQAIVAVCASRGWVAVCTGSVVNLWAVARQGLGPPNPPRGSSAARQHRAAAPLGFEHALSVELAELVGAKDGTGKRGDAKHVALYGNLLAVATDHAVFLVHLSFDVKGEVTSRCSSFTPAAGLNAPATPSSRGDAEYPTAASPQSHPPRSSPGDRDGDKRTTTTASRGSAVTLKSDAKDVPPKSSSRGGSSAGRGKSSGSAGVDEGSGRSPGLRKDGVKVKGKPERRDGIVERAISEADDVVVCVLDPGAEEDGREADGSAQLPPLLRSFEDDWEAFRARGEYSLSTEQSGLETAPLATGLTSSVVLPVSGNSTVLDRVGGCDIVLARRAGPGEVVKQLRLSPVSQRDDGASNSDGQQGDSRLSPSRSCRLVVLTTKAATTCLVCARPGANASASTTPSLSPFFSALGRPPSPAFSERRSPTPPSPSSLSTPPGGQRAGRVVGQGRSGGGGGGGGGRRVSSSLGDGSAGSVAGDDEHLDVFLRGSCRFNHDLVLASITRSFLFVLTVEGVEVWTFPSDQLSDKAGGRAGNGKWSEESGFGGAGLGTPLTLPSVSVSPHPSPRPCLLHVQRLEINGVLPRSPAGCMVPLGGAAPGLLLFPSPPANQGPSLSFIALQCRRRLRPHAAADDPDDQGGDVPASRTPPPPENPFSLGLEGTAASAEPGQEGWQRKFAAWRDGFCGTDRGGATRAASAPPLALFLRLRTPTEAFRLLSAAAERSLSARASSLSVFVAAAEGLHGALTAEAADAWRGAVCPDHADAGVGLAGRADALSDGAGGGATAAKPAKIEAVLAGLASCWRLQRVAARCASLLGRLVLETAVSIGLQEKWSDENSAAAGLAYRRACSWMLASEEPVVQSLALLRDAAARVLAVGGEIERTLSAEPSFVLVDDDDDDEDDDDPDDQSYLTTAAGVLSAPNLEKLLPRAMYESYLLPALGVGNNSTPEAKGRGPPVSDRGGKSSPVSLDDAVSGLVGYLHRQDMRQLSQRPGFQGLGDGRRPSTVPLSMAVVYADRIPWAACPVSLPEALAALDQQDKALAESTSGNISSSSGSSGTSLSGRKSPASGAGGVTKRSKPASKARRGSSDHRTGRSASGSSLDNNHVPATEGGTLLLPAQEWIAVARAVLLGYSEYPGKGGATGAASPGAGLLAADARILQLACERHPSLIVAHVAPARPGAGPLARDLLAGGRAQPVVAALVNLTSHSGSGERLGSDNASFGPHRARELLQLEDNCFSSPVDPLHALHVFGIAGRQMAARLDSLRRASLDQPGDFGFPSDARQFDGNPHEEGSEAIAVPSRQQEQRRGGDAKALSAAAREFLSRRCSASLATAGPSALRQERLSQALGAPEAWQASFARNRALDRAILRFLIGAHLDDLRALENSAAGGGNPKTSRGPPSGWGSGVPRTASRARNIRDPEGVADGSSWADTIVPLLSGQVSRARDGAAEEHVEAILRIIREISWRAVRADSSGGGGGCGRSMSQEEAEEVVTEAKRRLPVSELFVAPASARASASPVAPASANLRLHLTNDDEAGQAPDDDTHPWGSGGEGMGARHAPWPWGPRAVPASAVGAVLALAAALPPAGKLLAGLDVMLQVGAEVVAAAKSEAAVSAGAVAAASGAAGKGAGARGHAASKDGIRREAGETHAGVEEVCRAAERAVLLYTSEYCGKDPEKWASVTEHVRHTGEGPWGGVGEGPALDGSVSVDAAGHSLVRALLRKCGEELGGKAFVRALPESLTLVECLDEVELSLLND
eukprot:g10562.t1